MSSEVLDLFIPCEVLRLRARVRPDKGLSAMQQLVLEAVAAGEHRVDNLRDLFALSERMMLDLILELWQASHVVVNLAEGEVFLSEQARTAVEAGTANELEPVRAGEQSRKVMRELVSGHVLRVHRRTRRNPNALTAPESPSIVRGQVPETTRPELLRVLRGLLDRTPAGREQQLMSADVLHRTIDGRPVPTELRFMHIRVRSSVAVGYEGLAFQVVGPSNLAARVRNDIATGLERLSREMPELPVFKRLRERSSDQGLRPLVRGLPFELDRLRRAVARMDHSGAGTMDDVHERCQAIGEQILDLARQRLDDRVDVEVLAGADQFLAAARRALREAKRQVVLVCPWVHAETFERFSHDLKEVLQARRLDVFLLWGFHPNDRLSEEFARGLTALSKGGLRGALYWEWLPARTHAKLILRDGDLAIVGSFNYLNARAHPPAAEIAVTVRSADGRPCAPVLEMIDWARTVFNDPVTAAALLSAADSFDTSGEAVTDPPVPVPVHMPPAPGLASAVDDNSESAQVLVRSWAQAWRSTLERIEALAQWPGTYCRPVMDGDHTVLLWTALRNARHRLVIASDKLTSDVVDERLVAEIESTVRSGVRTAFVFQHPTAEAGARLERLRAAYPDSVVVIPARSHAKALIWDDNAVVSSFNFLSFEGDYSGPDRYRVRSEVGAHIQGREASDRVLSAIIDQVVENGAAVKALLDYTPPKPVGVPDEVAPVHRLLAELLSAGSDRQDRIAVLRAFARSVTSDELWHGLAVLDAAGLQPEEVDLAATAFLLEAGELLTEDAWHWLLRLAERAWHHERLLPATTFISMLEDRRPSPTLPPPWIAELTALVYAGAPEAALQARFATAKQRLCHMDASEVECAVLIAAVAVAEHGSPSALDLLQQVSAPPELEPLVLELTQFWQTYGIPVPVEQMARIVEVARDTTAAEAFRGSALSAYHQAISARMELPFGQRTATALFGPELVGRLKQMLENREVERARAWLTAHSGRQAREELVNRAAQLADGPAAVFIGYRRDQLLSRLQRILEPAQSWVDSVPPPADGRGAYFLNGAAQMGLRWSEYRSSLADLERSRAESRQASAPLFRRVASLVAAATEYARICKHADDRG
ncbi:MAG TPA: hypothetical protein VF665_22445 [Longimicrobium sp.]|jgi:phosphatidylserine/phosphatidylglycerophosphate/cardiolipin synthase-like enzyme|uniref:hypothetical protein n=1 Tax=Longimicrobium sp. TaxID=2029185 RepID=UPI002ED961E2